MSKRGLFAVIAIGVLLTIVLSGFASSLTRAEIEQSCAQNGGWNYFINEDFLPAYTIWWYPATICTSMGLTCINGWHTEGSSTSLTSTGWKSKSCHYTSTPQDTSGHNKATCCRSVATTTGTSSSGRDTGCSCPTGMEVSNCVSKKVNCGRSCSYQWVGGKYTYVCVEVNCNYDYTWSCVCPTAADSCDWIGDRKCTGTSSDGLYRTRQQCTRVSDGNPVMTSLTFSGSTVSHVYCDTSSCEKVGLGAPEGIGGDCARWKDLPTCKVSDGYLCYRGDCCKIDESLWTPNSANYCPSEQVQQTSNCGTQRNVTGTKAVTAGTWSDWSTCANGVQTRTCTPGQCGGTCAGPSTQGCCSSPCSPVGTKGCINDTTLGMCTNTTLSSTSSCLGLVSETHCQYGCSNAACNACQPSWDKNLANYCTTENVTQTDTLGCNPESSTRTVPGTKNCCTFKSGTSSWGDVLTVQIGSQLNMTVNGTNCSDGEKINITIYRYSASGNVSVARVNSSFMGNFARQNWTLQANLGAGTYFFNITLVANTSRSIKSGMLTATNPSGGQVCPNNIKEGTEVCDGGSNPCTIGGRSGTQTCKSDCTGWNACVAQAVTTCEEYDQGGCGSSEAQVVAQTYDCPSGTTCKCEWVAGKCTHTHPLLRGACEAKCVTSTVGQPTECVGDTKELVVKGTVIQTGGTCSSADLIDAECTTQRTITAPCGLLIELPFFGMWQFAASMLFVVAIYMYLHIRRIS